MQLRIVLLVLYFGIITSAISAKHSFRGSFRYTSAYESGEIKFKRNARFEFYRVNCTQREKGSGTYSVNNNELTLLFDDPADKRLTQKPSYTRQEACNNYSLLSFYFFRIPEPWTIPSVSVRYFDKVRDTFYGVSADPTGYARLRVPNHQFPVEVLIRYAADEEQRLLLDSAGDHSIKYPINPGFERPFIKGDTLKFRIGEFTGEALALKAEDADRFIVFKRL